MAAIRLLEEEKIDIIEDLNNAKHELKLIKEESEVAERLNELEKLNAELEEKVQQLSNEKTAVEEKLTRYSSENIELHEMIDKLSKGSSAESIEMVNLTAQDNEEYQKALVGHKDHGDDVGPEISQELNESLRSLREESSELMSKIELFTIERREVLDKLEALTIENQVLVSNIELVREDKVALEHENESLKEKLEEAERNLSELQTDKEELSKNVVELNEHRSKLQDEINKAIKSAQGSSEADEVAAGSTVAPTTPVVDKESCEKLWNQLEAEIQNLNKNKDKHQKIKISKKLSHCAKNLNTMMTSLLVDYLKSLDECKQLRVDLEKVKTSSDNKKGDELKLKLKQTEKQLSQRDEELKAVQVGI